MTAPIYTDKTRLTAQNSRIWALRGVSHTIRGHVVSMRGDWLNPIMRSPEGIYTRCAWCAIDAAAMVIDSRGNWDWRIIADKNHSDSICPDCKNEHFDKLHITGKAKK
jgi:hypothetical protein